MLFCLSSCLLFGTWPEILSHLGFPRLSGPSLWCTDIHSHVNFPSHVSLQAFSSQSSDTNLRSKLKGQFVRWTTTIQVLTQGPQHNICFPFCLLWVELYLPRDMLKHLRVWLSWEIKLLQISFVKLRSYWIGDSQVISAHLPVRDIQEIWVQSLGQEDLLQEGMEIHSSILAWRIPWTEETDGLQAIRHNWSDLART